MCTCRGVLLVSDLKTVTTFTLHLELGDIPVLYQYDDILFTPVSILSLNFYIEKLVYHRIPAYRKIPIQISILVL